MYTNNKKSNKSSASNASASSIITDIRIFMSVNKKSKLLAVANVTFCDAFVVSNFKIMDGRNGLFVSMPSVKLSDGKYKDTAYPITKEFRKVLNDSILKAFENMSENEDEDEESEDD